MVAGNIPKKLLLFSLPLVCTNILQVLFNMADIAIAGRFAGAKALACVGSTPFLVFIFTWLLVGLGNGINVIAAFYIGNKSESDLCETVDTAAVLSLASGIILGAIGFFGAGFFLSAMNTKPELLDGAVLYFKIYMLAMPAVAVYNFGNAVLSSGDDTKTPLVFLSVSGIVNVVLNLIFVVFFKLSVVGVALATVISLYISAFLVVVWCMLGKSGVTVRIFSLKLSFSKFVRIAKVGVPAGLQGAIFALANVFVQIGVNSFDSTMVAGVAACANADQLIYEVMGAFYAGCATFIGQNFGAGNKARVLQSYWWALLYSFVAGLILGSALYVFGKEFLFLFTSDAAVVDCGMHRLKIMAFSYCVSAFMDNTIAACRGLGKTFVPSIIVFLGSCVFRVAWVYTIFAWFRTIESLYLLFVFSWALTAFIEAVYFAGILKKLTGVHIK